MQLFFFLPANLIICQDIGLLVGETAGNLEASLWDLDDCNSLLFFSR